tara:strand:+ start:8686 stop:8883 length:198 start_codon:yes stop_codon:yes gene_type:complete
MIIDVRKYMPAIRRTCAEMVLKNGVKKLPDSDLKRELQHAVEILRKESTTRIGPVTKRNHKQKNK